jgi:hypothetical protein
MGISYDQSSRWQQLAAAPEAQFEAALAEPVKPNGVFPTKSMSDCLRSIPRLHAMIVKDAMWTADLRLAKRSFLPRAAPITSLYAGKP